MLRRLSASLAILLIGSFLAGCAATTGPGPDPLPGGSSAHAPDPQAAASILASLPVFPGARPSTVAVSQVVGPPLSSYLQVASATYNAPASGQRIKAWYERTLDKTGWKETASGSSSDHGKVTAYGVGLSRDPKRLVSVNLSFIPSQGSTTTYMVTVDDIAIPARPRASLVPTSVAQVVIRARASSMAAWRVKVVSEPAALRRWVRLVDSVTLLPSGRAPLNCALDVGQAATLTFRSGNGASWTFRVNPACASMTGPAGSLLSAGSVWEQVTALFGMTQGAGG